jgi:long-chain acyl-CoA synthetase
VVGDGEKMPSALIQPNWEYIEEWKKEEGVDISSDTTVACKDQRLRGYIQTEIDTFNEKFGKWEKIKTFQLTPDVWSIEGGHLTPTMKPKRKVIKEKYNDLYEMLYGR